jgi:hypothetical protein
VQNPCGQAFYLICSLASGAVKLTVHRLEMHLFSSPAWFTVHRLEMHLFSSPAWFTVHRLEMHLFSSPAWFTVHRLEMHLFSSPAWFTVHRLEMHLFSSPAWFTVHRLEMYLFSSPAWFTVHSFEMHLFMVSFGLQCTAWINTCSGVARFTVHIVLAPFRRLWGLPNSTSGLLRRICCFLCGQILQCTVRKCAGFGCGLVYSALFENAPVSGVAWFTVQPVYKCTCFLRGQVYSAQFGNVPVSNVARFNAHNLKMRLFLVQPDLQCTVRKCTCFRCSQIYSAASFEIHLFLAKLL